MKKLLFAISFILLFLIQPTYSAATKDIEQLADGTLTIGTDCAYAPYSFTKTKDEASSTALPIAGSNGYCDGYDMMIISDIADQLGVDVEVKTISFDGLIPALQSGEIDAIIAGMSPSEDRKESVDFSEVYYTSNATMSIVVPSDSKYANATKLSDWAGANISSQMGTFHGDILPQIPNITIAKPMDSVDVLMQSTETGVIDGYITEHESAESQAESNSKLTYVDLPTKGKDAIVVDEGYIGSAIAVKKGSDEFVKELNKAIDKISSKTRDQYMEEANQKADGTFVEVTTTSSAKGTDKYGAQLEDGVLTIGTDCAYSPYAFTTTKDAASDTAVAISGSNGYCDGYDIMMAQNIADQMGVDLEVKVISFDGLIPALNSGEIDAIIAGMSATPERAEQIDFTENYYSTDATMSIVVPVDSEYADSKTLDDWAGANISSQMGTFHGELLPQIPNIEIAKPLESVDALIQATKAGVIDGYITEQASAIAQADSQDDLTYVDLPLGGDDGLVVEDWFAGVAIGIKKDSGKFTDSMNTAISKISTKTRNKYMEEANAKSDGSYEEKEMGFLGQTWNLFITNKSLYAAGIGVTIELAIFGTLFGAIIGCVLVAMRIQKVHYKDKPLTKLVKKLLSTIAIIYIDIVRGTPMMVQAMVFFYGVAANIMDPNMAGIVIISFNTGAYVAEILRSGVNAIDSGQMEAGRSLGLTNNQTFIHIIVPQTIKNTMPALANQLVLNVKDSSVLSVIAVSELFYATKQAASAGYMYTQSYLIAAVIYLILTIALSRLLNWGLKKWLHDNSGEEVMTFQSIEEVVTND